MLEKDAAEADAFELAAGLLPLLLGLAFSVDMVVSADSFPPPPIIGKINQYFRYSFKTWTLKRSHFCCI